MAAPLVIGQTIVVPTTDGRIHAVDRASGALAWSFRSAGFQFSTLAQPAVVGNTIYADGGDEKTYALQASDGAVVWATLTAGATRDLFATNSRVYVVSYGKLFVLDRQTGAVITTWDGGTADGLESAPINAGSQLFITRTAGAWSFREP